MLQQRMRNSLIYQKDIKLKKYLPDFIDPDDSLECCCGISVRGKDLDVGNFLDKFDFEVYQLKQANKRKLPFRNDAYGASLLNEDSTIRFLVSSAENVFQIGQIREVDFTLQSEDAIKFLEQHEDTLREIIKFKGVDQVSLEFITAFDKEDFYNCFKFCPRLLLLAGEIGMSLNITFMRVYTNNE